MKKIIFSLLLLLSFSVKGQYTNWLNVKSAPFNAVGNGIADDYAALQAAIDSAVKTSATVYIPTGTYSTSAPLIAYRWTGSQYGQVYINIVGDDEMLSPGRTIIKPTFKNTFAFGIHLSKGSTVTGVSFEGLYDMSSITVDSLYKSPTTFVGDATCRDSRYSPYAAIVIDPFRGIAPPDGGYPGITSYYRGSDVTSGSTGLIFKDINIKGFTVGAIVSPNGLTLNGELMTFENVFVSQCKVAFAGCQAQEKGNRLINWYVSDKVRTAFVWINYGQGQPGHYILDGIHLDYGVADFIFRQSTGYFPMFANNIIAKDIARIGEWSTAINDAMTNSTFTFAYFDTTTNHSITAPHMTGTGMNMMNVHARYAGHPEVPIILANQFSEIYNLQGDSGQVNFVMGLYYSTASSWMYNYGYTATLFTQTLINWTTSGGVRSAVITDNIPPAVNDWMIITNIGNLSFAGLAKVTAVTPGVNYTISFISPGILNNGTTNYRLYRFNNTTLADWKPNPINGNANVYDTTIIGGNGDTIRVIRNLKRFTP